MPSPTDDETPFPILDHSEFHNYERSNLSPDDAFLSPPPQSFDGDGDGDGRSRMRHLVGGERSRSRRRKRAWKKLMWVKQSYPDNYTDQATFLENLQRNPRLKPYDFWPLVADSTVALQHVCSVILFLVCFVSIFRERVSPVSVVSWSTVATGLGWLLWERWVTEEDQEDELNTGNAVATAKAGSGRRRTRAGSMRMPPPIRHRDPSLSTVPSVNASAASSTTNLHMNLRPPMSASTTSLVSSNGGGNNNGSSNGSGSHVGAGASQGNTPRVSQENIADETLPYEEQESRLYQRLGTLKSATLIYSTLLGLSPILKSLTRSTSSDSIWAMSCWLLAINIFFFDYSGGVGAKFPASLSTNAALMASTVLASRLPSTKQVFSLTLLSIEVFGLFPVFRRHARHRSWHYHMLLTVSLVLGAGFGVGTIMGESRPWQSGILGMVIGVLLSTLGTGGCVWWLIGLQKYKNEIRGPWDPARPIIMSRPRWDDR